MKVREQPLRDALSMVKGIRSKWLERSGTRGVRKLLHVAEGYETYKGKGIR